MNPLHVVGSGGLAEAVVEMEGRPGGKWDTRVSKKWEKSRGHSLGAGGAMSCVLVLLSKAGAPSAGQPVCVIGRSQFPSSLKP